MSVFVNNIEPGASLEYRLDIPEDLHWKELKDYPFFGEIFCTSENKYYSRACGRRYRPKSVEHHLDEGHFQGYSFGVEHFSPVGGFSFRPFCRFGNHNHRILFERT